jgi:hypothetical protein
MIANKHECGISQATTLELHHHQNLAHRTVGSPSDSRADLLQKGKEATNIVSNCPDALSN